MDKRKNKILIGCLSLLLVMAVGYALFSETITINGTATAKGDFDISFTCDMVTKDNATTDEINNIYYTKGGSGNCSIDGQTITTTSTFTKPTDEVFFKVTLTNTGSIPVVLKTVDSDNNFSSMDGSVAGDEIYINMTYALAAYYWFIDEELSGDNTVEQAKITLESGESTTFYIIISWLDSRDAGLDTQPVLPEDGATINYNVTLGFEQITN